MQTPAEDSGWVAAIPLITGTMLRRSFGQRSDGVLISLGYNSRGVVIATAMSREIARRIIGSSTDQLALLVIKMREIRLHRSWHTAAAAHIAYGRVRPRLACRETRWVYHSKFYTALPEGDQCLGRSHRSRFQMRNQLRLMEPSAYKISQQRVQLMSNNSANTGLLQLTAQIVSAHIAHNSIQTQALPDLIQLVFKSLVGAGAKVAEPTAPEPAVPAKRSVFPDYIICLEDGKKLKMLKRHLATSYKLTPAQYRERWGLPSEYPMVAPEYAKRRSVLAKQIGLGRKSATATSSPLTASKNSAGRARKSTKRSAAA